LTDTDSLGSPAHATYADGVAENNQLTGDQVLMLVETLEAFVSLRKAGDPWPDEKWWLFLELRERAERRPRYVSLRQREDLVQRPTGVTNAKLSWTKFTAD
jgi:hypothetical protein